MIHLVRLMLGTLGVTKPLSIVRVPRLTMSFKVPLRVGMLKGVLNIRLFRVQNSRQVVIQAILYYSQFLGVIRIAYRLIPSISLL